MKKAIVILFVLWTLYSLTALTVLNIFQWGVIWLFGFFILIYCPARILNFISKKITSRHKSKNKNSNSTCSKIDMQCLAPQSKKKEIDIELFARECNSYIEHMEEMQEYTEYIQHCNNPNSNNSQKPN